MSYKNKTMYSFFIIPAIFLLVVGAQGSAKIVPTACDRPRPGMEKRLQ
jgi:hypothetical protein